MPATQPMFLTDRNGNPLTGQPVNNTQINGATIATGAGAVSSGTQRVVLATDQSSVPVAATGTPPTATGAQVVTNFLNANLLAAVTQVKATQGKLLRYRIYNPTAAVAFVQVFNAASAAAVTLGTTVPIEVYPVPAGGVLDGDQDFSFNYSAGIQIAATTTATGNTAPTTGLVVNLGFV